MRELTRTHHHHGTQIRPEASPQRMKQFLATRINTRRSPTRDRYLDHHANNSDVAARDKLLEEWATEKFGPKHNRDDLLISELLRKDKGSMGKSSTTMRSSPRVDGYQNSDSALAEVSKTDRIMTFTTPGPAVKDSSIMRSMRCSPTSVQECSSFMPDSSGDAARDKLLEEWAKEKFGPTAANVLKREKALMSNNNNSSRADRTSIIRQDGSIRGRQNCREDFPSSALSKKDQVLQTKPLAASKDDPEGYCRRGRALVVQQKKQRTTTANCKNSMVDPRDTTQRGDKVVAASSELPKRNRDRRLTTTRVAHFKTTTNVEERSIGRESHDPPSRHDFLVSELRKNKDRGGGSTSKSQKKAAAGGGGVHGNRESSSRGTTTRTSKTGIVPPGSPSRAARKPPPPHEDCSHYCPYIKGGCKFLTELLAKLRRPGVLDWQGLARDYPRQMNHPDIVQYLICHATSTLLLDGDDCQPKESAWQIAKLYLKGATILRNMQEIAALQEVITEKDEQQLAVRFLKGHQAFQNNRDVVVELDRHLPCNCLAKLKHQMLQQPLKVQCIACGKVHENGYVCATCNYAHYCSRECQAMDYSQHRPLCKMFNGKMSPEDAKAAWEAEVKSAAKDPPARQKSRARLDAVQFHM